MVRNEVLHLRDEVSQVLRAREKTAVESKVTTFMSVASVLSLF